MSVLRANFGALLAIVLASSDLFAAVFFHDNFDSHSPGPLAGQSAPVGGVWTLFDDNFFPVPDANEMVINDFFGTGGTPGAGQVFNLGELGVGLGNSISFPQAVSNSLYFQYDMLVPAQTPITTAGPQFWLEHRGGPVSTMTINVSSGNVFGEGTTANSGSASYGSARRLRALTTVNNLARNVQFSWWDLDDPQNSFTSPHMPLSGKFRPSKLHIYLNSSQEHIRSAQGFDNVWLVDDLSEITIPESYSLVVEEGVNRPGAPAEKVAKETDESVVVQQISAARQVWVRQQIRSLPFMIAGTLEFDRRPGVVDLHPGVQSYLNAGFEYLSVFEDADVRIADIGRDTDPSFPLLVLSNSDPVQTGALASVVAKHGSDRMMILRRDEPFSAQAMREVGSDIQWLRQTYPDALVFTNVAPFTHEATPNPIPANFMDILDPDVFMSDFIGPLWEPGGGTNRGGWIRYLRDHRQLAMDHNLPYYTYVGSHGSLNRLPSESDLRMVLFSALTYGYSGFNYLSYSAQFDFDGVVDKNGNPTHVYNSASSANPEVFRLGEVLKFAESRDMFYIPGHHKSGSSEVPNDVLYSANEWNAAIDQDSHIRDISIVQSGLRKDGVIGFFNDDNGQDLFMLTNFYSGQNLSAAAATLTFRMLFDPTIDSLLRINRQTGVQEVVPLSGHQLIDVLPGGTGNLYKYNNGVDFFSPLPLPTPPSSCDLNGDLACGRKDINLMFRQGNLVTGVNVTPSTEKFDLVNDNVINQLDIDRWLSLAATRNGYDSPYLRGDTDGLDDLVPADVYWEDNFDGYAAGTALNGQPGPNGQTWHKSWTLWYDPNIGSLAPTPVAGQNGTNGAGRWDGDPTSGPDNQGSQIDMGVDVTSGMLYVDFDMHVGTGRRSGPQWWLKDTAPGLVDRNVSVALDWIDNAHGGLDPQTGLGLDDDSNIFWNTDITGLTTDVHGNWVFDLDNKTVTFTYTSIQEPGKVATLTTGYSNDWQPDYIYLYNHAIGTAGDMGFDNVRIAHTSISDPFLAPERDVDLTDFNVLAANYEPFSDGDQTNGPRWGRANFDGDDDVDITDFNYLAANYAPGGYGGTNAIPEPSSVVLFILGLVGWGFSMLFCRQWLQS